MATWIIPALKTVLPHVGTIITAARPMFSKSRSTENGGSQHVQIAELQAAVAQNDSNIRELAEQLQHTISTLEQAAIAAQVQSRSMERLCWMSAAMAGVALLVALIAIATR